MSTQSLQRDFLSLRDQFIWLQTCYNTYLALYDSGPETEKILTKSAPLFFQDLNSILIEYCILQISKITDPAQSMGRENLTIPNIDLQLQTLNIYTQDISNASSSLMRYRNLIKDSRNRVISHQDKQVALANVPIGAHSEYEVTEFFSNLHTYSDAVGNTIGVGPLDFSASAGAGDVHDLLSLLRRA